MDSEHAKDVLLSRLRHGSSCRRIGDRRTEHLQGSAGRCDLECDPLAIQPADGIGNQHDIKAIHEMFWQSPSALLVAKSAIPSEGNWANYWGNDAIDQKLSDIAASRDVVLTPDLSKLKVLGRTDKWGLNPMLR
jgi:hypothetical protein